MQPVQHKTKLSLISDWRPKSYEKDGKNFKSLQQILG